MLALVLCALAFAAGFLAGRRSLVNGLIAVLSVGYFYGIVRANVLSPFSHFTFDASLAGLYLSRLLAPANPADARRSATLRIWVWILIGWAALVSLMPFQPFLVSMVGLRGAVFFLPVCLLATELKSRDLIRLCYGLAALNLLALCFAFAEYVVGIERFFPLSPVTAIIYASNDVANYQYHRIPATFVTAHAYAGTMVTSLPFLIGVWIQSSLGRVGRLFLLSGIAAAALGVLMANTRINVVIAVVIALAALLQGRMKISARLVWCGVLTTVALLAISNVRFQRFTSLSDTDAVTERVHGSVNRTFFEILLEYPMGNGLGGGGTSMPSFLADRVRNPVAIENEYGRILLEQGIVGLVLWAGFIIWFFAGSPVEPPGPWQTGRRLVRYCCAAYLITGMIGTGTLTSIPQTLLMLLGMGWVMVKPSVEPEPRARSEVSLRSSRMAYAR